MHWPSSSAVKSGSSAPSTSAAICWYDLPGREATSTLVLPNASETNRPPSSAMPLRIACLAVSESLVLRVEWKVVVTMNPSA